MEFRRQLEELYQASVREMTQCERFAALEAGTLTREQYDRFVANVVRAHLRSPQLLAFLFALAPGAAAENLLHNMLEELGIEEESGVAHPSLLREMARGAGLGPSMAEIEGHAAEDIRQVIVEPLIYATLKEVGFAALIEVEAFEYMLARAASRIARALKRHRGLDDTALAWLTHHSEVDIEHSEQGLDAIDAYVRYYGLDPSDALTIAEMTLRENVFIKRYFGEAALNTTGRRMQ